MTSAAQFIKGRWVARWGNWSVDLEWQADAWKVILWRQRPGRTYRHLLAEETGFVRVEEAVAWACRIMRTDGAQVMILGREDLTLESILSFKPALEVVLA